MTKDKDSDRLKSTPADLTEADLAQRKMGDNALQGHDQSQVRNQRHAVPDAKLETDGVVESLEKLDDDVRAERDLGKGNRSSPTPPSDDDR